MQIIDILLAMPIIDILLAMQIINILLAMPIIDILVAINSKLLSLFLAKQYSSSPEREGKCW